MAELPILPLKTDALLADTTHMSAEEFGAYCRILFVMWRQGGMLKDDDGEMAAITGLPIARWRKVKEKVTRPMTLVEGTYSQKRLTDTWLKVRERRQTNAEAGTAGGNSRWGHFGGPPEGRVLRSQRLSAARALGRHSKEEWTALVQFCGNRCVQCQRPGPLVKDHIVPIYAGGSDAIDNLQPLCVPCNSSKGPDSTDHRPDGWRDALRMPSERLARCLPLKTKEENITSTDRVERAEGLGNGKTLNVASTQLIASLRRPK